MALAEIATGLGALKTAMEISKSIQMAETELDQAVVKNQMAEIYSALADAKMALSDAKSSLKAKDDAIDSLRKSFSELGETAEFRGLKYRKGSDGEPRGLPYCSVCLQKDGILMLTVEMRGAGIFCPSCKAPQGRARIFVDE